MRSGRACTPSGLGERPMKLSAKTARMGLMASALSVAALAAGGLALQARADGAPVAGPARVGDFMLADQNLLAKQLYHMADAKAVVIVTYAPGDAVLKAEAPGLMAMKAAYA